MWRRRGGGGGICMRMQGTRRQTGGYELPIVSFKLRSSVRGVSPGSFLLIGCYVLNVVAHAHNPSIQEWGRRIKASLSYIWRSWATRATWEGCLKKKQQHKVAMWTLFLVPPLKKVYFIHCTFPSDSSLFLLLSLQSIRGLGLSSLGCIGLQWRVFLHHVFSAGSITNYFHVFSWPLNVISKLDARNFEGNNTISWW